MKEAPIAVDLMIPLVVVTILFSMYLRKQHYHVARFLPMEDSGTKDAENKEDGMGLDFLKDAYLQPAVKNKTEVPHNYDQINGGITANETGNAAAAGEYDKTDELSV